MPSHKVRVGDVVLPKPALSQNIAGGTYQVTRLLPESGELNIGSRILRSRTSVLRGKVSLPQHRQLKSCGAKKCSHSKIAFTAMVFSAAIFGRTSRRQRSKYASTSGPKFCRTSYLAEIRCMIT